MSRIPIRLRLTLAFVAAMTVVFAGLGLFVYLRYEHELNETIDQGLRNRAGDLAALVARSGSGLGDPGSGFDREESLAQVLTPSGEIVDATPQVSDRSLLTSAELERTAEGETFFDRSSVPGLEEAGEPPSEGEEGRLLARRSEATGGELVVVVGASVEDRSESLASLLTILLVGGPIALLLASLAGYAVAGAALRPVESMRRRAAEITAAEPDRRLPLPEADDALRRLAETLNEMLGRLDTALARERAFVDDASHELRTPLALHKTELELALRYGKSADELRTSISSAIVEVDRLIALAEDLLVLARSEQGKLALELRPVSLADLLARVRERFGVRTSQAGRDLVIEPADGIQVEGDRLRIDQALTNLVENALEHGRGEIKVHAVRRNGAVELHVTDRGPGFPPEFLDRAFERFSRADSGRTGGGTGLGLAIVEAIARAHRGTAGASNREGGGADVWIRLPG